jgi:hypothetical protein
MSRWWRITLWLALAFGAVGEVAAEGTRLAVWASPERRDLAALLIAELSGGSSGYELLGREEMARAVAEQEGGMLDPERAARAGRLLGAAGVAWLGEITEAGGTRLVLRLSTVESGLVVGWRIDDPQQADAARWAKRAAAELETWRPKLALDLDGARAVSLLNLRSGGGTGERKATDERGRTLTILLGQALASAPRLWVAERWRLDDLAWETVIGGAAVNGFWAGAAVVDGSFTEFEGEIALTLRMRRLGAEEERWTTKNRDAGALVEAVAAEVERRLGGRPSGADNWPRTWDREAEAREFLDEAQWAARQQWHDLAVEAIEAALALGERSPAARRLQYLVHGRRAWGPSAPPFVPPVGGGDVSPWVPTSRPPALERVEAAREVFARFADFQASPTGRAHLATRGGPPRDGPMMNARPLTLAEIDTMEQLQGAARLLRDGYFARGTNAETESALRGLRAEARALFEREWTALAATARPREAGAGVPGFAAGQMHHHQHQPTLYSLPLVGFAHGAWWTERLSDHQGFARQLLEREIAGEPTLFRDLLLLLRAARPDAWEVDWTTRDPHAARASWDRVGREWMKADDLGLALAGAFQVLALNPPFPASRGLGPPPGAMPQTDAGLVWRFGTEEENRARQVAGLGFFGRKAEELARGLLPKDLVMEALRLSPGEVPDAVRDAWADGLASWWERGEGFPGAELVLMSGIVRYTPEQEARLQAARTKRQGVRPAEVAPVVLPPLKKPGVRQEKLDLTRAWIVPEVRALEWDPKDYRRGPNIRWLERRDGRVRVVSEAEGANYLEKKMRLTEIDLATMQERQLGAWVIEDDRFLDNHLFPAHALLGRWIFSVEGDVLRRRGPATGEVREMTLPMLTDGPIWAIGDHLYATSKRGAIARVEPESGAWEILADSQRRPAQGELDDRMRYDVKRIWRAADGVLRAYAGIPDRVYVYDEAGRAWRKEKPDPTGPQLGDGYDRADHLEQIRGTDLAVQHYGRRELERLVEDLDRSGKYQHSAREVAAVHLLGTHRPPPKTGYPSDTVLVFHPFGGTVAGEDVWALLRCMSNEDWSPRLVWLPRRGKEIVAVELRMPNEWMDYMARRYRSGPYSGLGGEYARLSVGPEGLVFYAMDGAAWWLMPASELEAVGVEVPPK